LYKIDENKLRKTSYATKHKISCIIRKKLYLPV
jgi:hypothetical protein